jgi:EAL domain-containing protein (putative c-di-GMP-specific phosphodiesterase class I)
MSRGIVLQRPELFPQPSGMGVIGLPGVAARGRLDHPGLTILVGSVATSVLMVLQLVNLAGIGVAAEDAHVLVSAGAATLAMFLLACRPGHHILRYRPLTVAVAFTGVGLGILNVAPTIGLAPASLVANATFSLGAGLAMAVILPALYRRLDKRTAVSAGLDGGIMLVAGITIMISLWRTGPTSPTDPIEFVMPVLGATLFASAGIAAISALAMRIEPALRGVWCGIAGVSVLGLCWVIWIDRTLHSQQRDGVVSILYSAGILLVAYAWMTWSEEVGAGDLYLRLARWLADWLPVGAILLCVGVAAIPHARINGIDPAPAGTAMVILLTIGRQRLLILSERLASRRLAGEVEERAQTMISLSRLEQAETLEGTAQRICDEALRLDGIRAAGVYVFGPSGRVMPLALRGAVRPDEGVGDPIDAARAEHMRSCASQGTWADGPDTDSPRGVTPLAGEAFAPMRWDDRIVGVVAMGVAAADQALRLPERFSTLTEFGVVSAALMGPTLSEHWRLAGVRDQLERVITDHAFLPVFQPIVRLNDRHIVGYEALTRFRDGTRPDKRFIEAHTAGMSIRLEMVCLGDQLEAATWLPAGTWVSLNISPSLASAIVPLVSALERADRDVVLEITEHVEIADYKSLVGALDMVRGHARLAVDDAGAGYAGLRHILELRPQFVKLDLSLVRNIDTDPARQAMVAGMAHFARDSGCELIAEGIETPEELAELIRLEVQLGQGYLFGKPAPIV